MILILTKDYDPHATQCLTSCKRELVFMLTCTPVVRVSWLLAAFGIPIAAIAAVALCRAAGFS